MRKTLLWIFIVICGLLLFSAVLGLFLYKDWYAFRIGAVVILAGIVIFGVIKLREPAPPVQAEPTTTASRTLKFKNPQNNYIVSTDSHGAYTLLFGSFYFMKHGAWGHGIVSLLLALLTAGISWFVYPFFGKKIIRDTYLRKGWLEVA